MGTTTTNSMNISISHINKQILNKISDSGLVLFSIDIHIYTLIFALI